MKRFVVFTLMFLAMWGGTVLAQENKTITELLDKKYGFACYHNTNGGWYSVIKGEDDKANEGACDLTGKEVVPAIYDDVHYVGNGYYEVELNKKSGMYLNGKMFLPCKYDKLYSFQFNDDKNKYVEVEIEGKKGLLHKNGTEFVPCKYDELRSYQFNDDNYAE